MRRRHLHYTAEVGIDDAEGKAANSTRFAFKKATNVAEKAKVSLDRTAEVGIEVACVAMMTALNRKQIRTKIAIEVAYIEIMKPMVHDNNVEASLVPKNQG